MERAPNNFRIQCPFTQRKVKLKTESKRVIVFVNFFMSIRMFAGLFFYEFIKIIPVPFKFTVTFRT